METVLLVIHLMVVIALVGVVLLQRSEGGALGIGGGGGFMTSRGTANVLTRATSILAIVFFVTSLGLTLLPRYLGTDGSILDSVAPAPSGGADAPVGQGGGGILDDLQRLSPGAQVPAAPAAPAPAAPAPASPAPAAPAPAVLESPAAPAAAPTVPSPTAPAQ